MSLLDSLLGGYVFAQQSGAPSAVPSRRTLIFAGATVIDDGPTANSTTILISGGGGSFPGGDLCSGTGTSVAVGSGLVLSSGTLSAPSPFVHASTELLDGTGAAITVGSRLSLSGGALSADNQFTGTSLQLAAGDGSAVTVGSGLSLAAGTITATGAPGSYLAIDANDILVYHCNETSGTTLSNSASAVAPLSLSGTYQLNDKGLFSHGTAATLWTATGAADAALATGQSIFMGANFTIEVVLDWNCNIGTYGGVAVEIANDARTAFMILGNVAGATASVNPNTIQAAIQSTPSGVNYSVSVISVANVGSRVHFAVTRNGTSMLTYLNGSVVATNTLSASAALGTFTRVSIGNNTVPDQPYRGRIAEVRLSNITRDQTYMLSATLASGAL